MYGTHLRKDTEAPAGHSASVGMFPFLRVQTVPGEEEFIWPDLLHQLGENFPSLTIVMLDPLQRDSAVACKRLTLASDQMHLFSVLIMAFVSFSIVLF